MHELNIQEKETILSLYDKTGFCEHCCRPVCMNCEIMVNYISLRDIISLHLMPSQWPILIENNHYTNEVKCPQCEKPVILQESRFKLSSVLFVEFSPGLGGTGITFPECISVLSTGYTLMAIVRNLGNHFSCAVKQSAEWIVYDDLCSNAVCFESLEELYLQSNVGWFFGVYKKSVLDLSDRKVKRLISLHVIAFQMDEPDAF